MNELAKLGLLAKDLQCILRMPACAYIRSYTIPVECATVVLSCIDATSLMPGPLAARAREPGGRKQSFALETCLVARNSWL